MIVNFTELKTTTRKRKKNCDNVTGTHFWIMVKWMFQELQFMERLLLAEQLSLNGIKQYINKQNRLKHFG